MTTNPTRVAGRTPGPVRAFARAVPRGDPLHAAARTRRAHVPPHSAPPASAGAAPGAATPATRVAIAVHRARATTRRCRGHLVAHSVRPAGGRCDGPR